MGQNSGSGKLDDAFRTIGEVSAEVGVPQHVLRFWESKFSQVRPMKRGGGRRYYHPKDIDLIVRIRDLLYRDGYTIKGAQKILKTPRSDAESRPRKSPVSSRNAPAPQATDTGKTGSAKDRDASLLPSRPASHNLGEGGRVENSPDRQDLRALLDELVRVRSLLDKPLT